MTIIDGIVLLVGLAVGSFLNVCIHRIPKGESVVLPASRCPNCKSAIRPWHNIPVLGFLLLKGKCRACRQPIGWIYPAVEILTAAVLYSAFLKFGLSIALAINALFFAILIVLNFIDLFHRILPDVLTLGGAVVGFLVAPWQSRRFFEGDPLLPAPISMWDVYAHSLAGILIGGGMLWLAAYLYLKLRRVEGMGFGDIKMMAMVGAFLGWRFAWGTIFAGSLLGAVIGSIYLLARGKGRRYELPFGSFLAVGAILNALWGPEFLQWYLDTIF